jgi:hypothetical protein
VEYLGHEIKSGGLRFDSEAEARKALQDYLAKKEVTVHYAPESSCEWCAGEGLNTSDSQLLKFIDYLLIHSGRCLIEQIIF